MTQQPEQPEMTPEGDGLSNLLDGVDLDASLADLINNLEWLTMPVMEGAELERLDALVPEIVQDLTDRDLLPAMPELDREIMQDAPAHEHDHDVDIDR
jgi:hypothetical protein